MLRHFRSYFLALAVVGSVATGLPTNASAAPASPYRTLASTPPRRPLPRLRANAQAEHHEGPADEPTPHAVGSRPTAKAAYTTVRRGVADRAALKAELDAPLAAQFPRLAPVLHDPDSFIATMSQRFATQKGLTPADPYRFDYSEIGMPLVKDMRADLGAKLDELSRDKNPRTAGQRQVAIEHLTALAGEADHYLAKGAVSYRSMIECSHFYGRAIGQFDKKTFPLFKRAFLKIDESLEGYEQRSPERELADYKARRFFVFDPSKKTRSSGFAEAQSSFESAVFDPSGLKTILVPTNDEITQHLLLRLASRENINMVGVTAKPILADGFLRPSGLFWTHDMRHQSAKFFKKKQYIAKEGLSAEQVDGLNHLMDGFYVDLRKETNAVTDPQLREAIKLLTFNYFFDRGHPMVPSAYLDHPADHITHALYFAEKVGGQKVKFGKPLTHLKRADEWMRAFWKEREPAERELLARSKPAH